MESIGLVCVSRRPLLLHVGRWSGSQKPKRLGGGDVARTSRDGVIRRLRESLCSGSQSHSLSSPGRQSSGKGGEGCDFQRSRGGRRAIWCFLIWPGVGLVAVTCKTREGFV